MRVVSLSKACASFGELVDQVIVDGDYAVIVRDDAAGVVVMSLATFDSLIETVHLLRSPGNSAHLARSIGELQQGSLVYRGPDDAT